MMAEASFLEQMAQPGRQEVEVAGRLLRPGCRVKLKPRPGGDLLDVVLKDRTAVIEGIDEDDTGVIHVAVVIDDRQGRDLAETRHPAQRFFFAPDELEPFESVAQQRRVLVAGIGNIFLGDDGFGVAVAQQLLQQNLPSGVEVADFGIRGMDLAYALGRNYDAAILIDAVPMERPPGTLQLIEPELNDDDAALFPDSHRMDPLAVLRLARRLGPLPGQVLVIGCQPEVISDEWEPETAMQLSPTVAAAVDEAVAMVQQVVEKQPSRRRPRKSSCDLGLRPHPSGAFAVHFHK